MATQLTGTVMPIRNVSVNLIHIYFVIPLQHITCQHY